MGDAFGVGVIWGDVAEQAAPSEAVEDVVGVGGPAWRGKVVVDEAGASGDGTVDAVAGELGIGVECSRNEGFGEFVLRSLPGRGGLLA